MKPILPRLLLSLVVLLAILAPTVRSEEPSTQTAQEQVLPQALSDIHSDDPSVYLNYATIMFYNGQQLLRGGKSEEAQTVFRHSEEALHVALQRSEADPDRLRRSLVRSQASFLLGELNFFVLGDKAKAKTLYEDALRECPQHAAAVAALARVLIPPQ
jgi:hypothetical protein